MDHLRIKVQVAESNSNDDEPTRPLIQQAHPPPVLFRESAFSRPILPATSSLLLPPPPKPRPAPGPPAPGPERYRECLRNHAASLGAHVLDGCGEFMPWGPAEPLRCAACGCHRSFHRKEQPQEPEPEPETETETEAPVLLAPPKSSRESSSEEQRNKQKQKQQKKRFRSKFSGEQKGKMAAFAERVGWRLQKKDESDTERFCRDVGVSTRVLKVWMHNNKHLNIRGSKLRPDQDDDDDQEEVQQQYYQPQPDQPLGEEKKKTTKK